ncbi:hypothetical protein [Nocardia sp. NPDC057030]|uniref:hypothetical protein n=1 Tax=unclassified Nocardia TaxID=2637762 RepID=UPI00364388C8
MEIPNGRIHYCHTAGYGRPPSTGISKGSSDFRGQTSWKAEVDKRIAFGADNQRKPSPHGYDGNIDPFEIPIKKTN